MDQEALSPEKTVPASIHCKRSRAIKAMELSSNLMGNGDTMQKYTDAENKINLIDLDLKGLKSSTQAEDLKKISGVKHVISA